MKKAPRFVFRFVFLSVAFSLLAASGLAMSQAPKPAPAEEKPASPVASPLPAPGPRLNLKLDDAGRYAQENGGSTDALPSLGGDARLLQRAPDPTPTSSARPFPKDTERGER